MAVNDYPELPQRLADVRGRIADACARAGRPVDGVRLVAISKRHPVEAIMAAHAAGQRDFGENYVQEMRDKLSSLDELEGMAMRFVGRLQRNKVGDVVGCGCSVDTVDSERLARALSRRAATAGVVVDVLLQVNIGHEPQKAGVMPDEVGGLVELVSTLPGLRLGGLMAIPPATDTGGAARADFERMHRLVADLGLAELSMGMSADLELAVELGATMVRIGTAIFGPRPD